MALRASVSASPIRSLSFSTINSTLGMLVCVKNAETAFFGNVS